MGLCWLPSGSSLSTLNACSGERSSQFRGQRRNGNLYCPVQRCVSSKSLRMKITRDPQEMATIERSPLPFTQFYMHSSVCMCIVLCNFFTFADLCNHNHNQNTELFLYSQLPPIRPHPLATTNLFFIILSFLECFRNGIIYHTTF